MKKVLSFIAILIVLTLTLTGCKLQEDGDKSSTTKPNANKPPLVLPDPVKSEDIKQKIAVHLFWREGCPYCVSAKEFFAEIKDEYSECFELVLHDTGVDSESKLFFEISEKLKVPSADQGAVPFTVIGDEYEIGYASVMNDDIINKINKQCSNEKYNDLVGKTKSESKKSK